MTTPLPEPVMYAHELIENNGGVWLGVNTEGICEQAHTPGETGDIVLVLYTADQLRAYGAAEYKRGIQYAAMISEHYSLRSDDMGAIIAEKIRKLGEKP